MSPACVGEETTTGPETAGAPEKNQEKAKWVFPVDARAEIEGGPSHGHK